MPRILQKNLPQCGRFKILLWHSLCEVFLKNQLYKLTDSPFAALFGKLYDVWNFRDFFYGVGGAGFKPDGGQKLEIVYVVPDIGDFAEAYADFPAKFRNCFNFWALALKQIVDFKLFCPAAYNFGVFGSYDCGFYAFCLDELYAHSVARVELLKFVAVCAVIHSRVCQCPVNIGCK